MDSSNEKIIFQYLNNIFIKTGETTGDLYVDKFTLYQTYCDQILINLE